MPPRQGVEVHGLKDFRKELKQIDDQLPKELAKANFDVATMVVQRARARALTVSAGARKAAESLTAARLQRGAAVRLGGARYPFAAGYEFGSDRYKQFPPFRGAGSTAGYYVYPTIRAEHDDIVETYSQLLAEVTRQAFPS